MEDVLELKNFLELSYGDLRDMNRRARAIDDPTEAEKLHRAYLEKEKRIKAVTVCFSDIEGRLHMLDYDKDFFLSSLDNLTFDGSSIAGFSKQNESDLKLGIDWTSLTFVPADVFGPGKVLVFGNAFNRDGTPYPADLRGILQEYVRSLKEKKAMTIGMAPEIEGFLLKGIEAEQNYDDRQGFQLVSGGGYFHSLPLDDLRRFIDAVAEAQRAMGFNNEKDHPEVAPSQFEINFSYTDAVRACDQIQLYKLVCRQIADRMGMTATFLPKPITGINGNGMHLNISVSKKGKNLFYQNGGPDNLSPIALDFVERLLNRATDLCLVLNSSVNAYRRLDPSFEAPNQIKVSANDRGSMIRIPFAGEKSARIEIRSVAPDANPYMAMFTVIKTGLEDELPAKSTDSEKRSRLRFLPGTIQDAIRLFKTSEYTTDLLGVDTKDRYLARKVAVANRSHRELGTKIKDFEVLYHHEVTNQYLWGQF